MKQLLKLTLVLVISLTIMVNYSYSNSLMVKQDTNRVTKVDFNNVKGGTSILIKDRDDKVLYSEQIHKTGEYSKNFDLSTLPNARYYFEINKESEIEIIPFSINNGIPEFISKEEYVIAKPEVVVKDNFVYISKKLMGNQTLKIDVYYEGWDLAYHEKFKDAYSLSRVYDFSNSEKGNYTIVIKSEGRIFKNNIKL